MAGTPVAPVLTSGAPAFLDSQDNVIKFNGVTLYSAKADTDFGGSSSASASSNNINVSTVNQAAGTTEEYQAPPLAAVASSGGTGVLATISVEGYLPNTTTVAGGKPDMSASHPLDLGKKYAISGTAKCTGYKGSLVANDVVKVTYSLDLMSIDATYTPK